MLNDMVLSVALVILNFIMLNVVILSVVVPCKSHSDRSKDIACFGINYLHEYYLTDLLDYSSTFKNRIYNTLA